MVSVVPVPLLVPGTTVPTVPVSGSSSVLKPPCSKWHAHIGQLNGGNVKDHIESESQQ